MAYAISKLKNSTKNIVFQSKISIDFYARCIQLHNPHFKSIKVVKSIYSQTHDNSQRKKERNIIPST